MNMRTALVWALVGLLFVTTGTAQPPEALSVGKPERTNPHVDGALEILLEAVRDVAPFGAVGLLGYLPRETQDAVAKVAQMVGVPLSADRSEVTVVLETRGTVSVQAAGAREATSSPTGLTLAVVPLTQLEDFLEQMAGTAYVRLPYEPYPLGVTSQGADLIGASAFHAAGQRGAGAKVAIIDLGFRGLSSSQSRGDLPHGVTTRDFTGRGIESDYSHGTAVAEIVHDVAPDAQLYLIKVGNEVDLDNAVSYAISQGIHIINHSLGWYNTNYYDGTGSVAQIAKRATDAGILWVQAAGNDARSHYSATFTDRNSDGWHDTDVTLSASSGDPITLYLTWNSWPTTGDDYDLYLYGPTGNLVASSSKTQGGTEQPTERLTFSATQGGTYRVRINRASGAVRSLKLFSIYQDLSPYVSRSSIPAPGNLDQALTVGSVDWSRYTSGPAQDYSSRGPTTDGRQKPDLVAPDNVSTGVSYYDPFPGTSAAAPHVAGAAALLRGEDSSATGSTLRSRLLGMTVFMGDANTFGSGRLESRPAAVTRADLVVDAIDYSPSSPTVGSTLSFQVTVRNAGGAAAGEFYVRLQGDGPRDEARVASLSAGATRTLSFSLPLSTSPESFTATADVYDQVAESDEGNNTRQVTVTAAVAALRADPGGPYSASVNQSITFDGRGSQGDIVEYRWELGDGSTRYGSTVQHAYSQAGTYTVRLTVRARDGRTDSATTYATVQEQRLPDLIVDRLDYSPSAPRVGDNVSFSITVRNVGNADAGAFYVRLQGASDQRQSSLSGLSAGSSRTVTLSLPLSRTPETFTAIVDPYDQVRESDEGNNRASVSITAAAANQPPVAGFSFSPSSPNVNEWVSFDASSSYDPDGYIASYSWNFGDGATGSGRTTQKRYSSAGTYTVRLTVTDDQGATDTTTRSLTVASPNQPPTARFTFSPTNPDPGQSVSFDASTSSDPDGTIASYSWNFGDGTNGSGRTTSHAYSAEGNYTVRLTVTDDQGATDSTTHTVQVGTPPPTLPGMPTLDKPGIYVWGDAQNRWHVTVAGSSSWGSARPFYVLLNSVGSFRDVTVTPSGSPDPTLQFNDKRLTWQGSVGADWVDLSFTLERGRVMQLTLYLDTDGDGEPKPATSAQAAAMVYLRDKKVSPRSNPLVFAAPDGARTLLPNANFHLATGSTAVHVIYGTIEELERTAR